MPWGYLIFLASSPGEVACHHSPSAGKDRPLAAAHQGLPPAPLRGPTDARLGHRLGQVLDDVYLKLHAERLTQKVFLSQISTNWTLSSWLNGQGLLIAQWVVYKPKAKQPLRSESKWLLANGGRYWVRTSDPLLVRQML
jgi:hypothetical protein